MGAGTAIVLATDILNILPLLVKAYGAGSVIVSGWIHATGLNEADLFAQAEKVNVETRAAAQAHIDALTKK